MSSLPSMTYHRRLFVCFIAFGFVMLTTQLQATWAGENVEEDAASYASVISDKLSRGDADSIAIAMFVDSLEYFVSGRLVKKAETRAVIFELLAYTYVINVSDSTLSDSLAFASMVNMLEARPTQRLTQSRILDEFPRLRTIYLEARLVANPPRSFWKRKSSRFGAAALSLLLGTAALLDLGPFADDHVGPTPLANPPPPPAQ